MKFTIDTLKSVGTGTETQSGTAKDKKKQSTEAAFLNTKKHSKINIVPAQKKKAENSGANDEPPPAYNYGQHIEDNKPLVMSVGGNPWMYVMNIQDTIRWTSGMLNSGRNSKGQNMTMGNKYFVGSGTCDHVKSDKACKGKKRYLYIDNVPSTLSPCADPGLPADPKSAKGDSGLIQGILGDVMEMNPFEFISSATGDGSVVNDKCVLRQEYVGNVNPGEDYYANLHLVTKCSPPREPLICSVGSNSSSGCIKYTPGTKKDVLYFNKLVNNWLNTVKSNPPLESSQLRKAPLSANDSTWRKVVHIVNERFQDAIQDAPDGDPAVIVSAKNTCELNAVTCTNKYMLYQWLVVYQISSDEILHDSNIISEFTYQVQWTAYYDTSNGKIYVIDPSMLVGNSYMKWIDEPDTFKTIEGFSNCPSSTYTSPYAVSTSQPQILHVILFWLILCITLVLLLYRLYTYFTK